MLPSRNALPPIAGRKKAAEELRCLYAPHSPLLEQLDISGDAIFIIGGTSVSRSPRSLAEASPWLIPADTLFELACGISRAAGLNEVCAARLAGTIIATKGGKFACKLRTRNFSQGRRRIKQTSRREARTICLPVALQSRLCFRSAASQHRLVNYY